MKKNCSSRKNYSLNSNHLICLIIFLFGIDISVFAQTGLQSNDSGQRAMAARSIAETGKYSPTDIALLINCLNDHTRLIPSNVTQIGNSLYTRDSRETSPSDEAIKALVRIGKPAVEKLLLTAKTDSASFGKGYNSVKCLGLIGDKTALPVLLKLLNQGKIGNPNSSGDQDEIPRAVAIIGGKEVYNELLAAYEKAKANNQIGGGIIDALGYSKDERFLPILIEMFNSGDRYLKLDIIPALGYSKSKNAIPILAENLKSEDYHIRWYSCQALEKIGHRDALPYLKELVKTEEDSDIKKAAEKAIKKIER
jgi:HEAT repeat protein